MHNVQKRRPCTGGGMSAVSKMIRGNGWGRKCPFPRGTQRAGVSTHHRFFNQCLGRLDSGRPPTLGTVFPLIGGARDLSFCACMHAYTLACMHTRRTSQCNPSTCTAPSVIFMVALCALCEETVSIQRVTAT